MHPMLNIAVRAARKAGTVINRASFDVDSLRTERKQHNDFVTEVDRAAEAAIIEVIKTAYPDHAILAEESGQSWADGETASENVWVIDPLDGTTNFAHGLPIFCASLAVEIDGTTEVAAVYDPCRRELFTAERGGGAFLNGAPLHVSAVPTLLDALLVTGFPYDVHTSADEIVGLFDAFVRRAQAVRRLGSAALDLCYVAAGRMDGFWEQRLKPWDVAAGALIVEEAGGQATGIDGSAFNSRAGHVVASNGAIHAEMAATIAAFAARRSPNVTR